MSGYAFRKKGAIVATVAGAQTNYQLTLLVGESSGAIGEDVDCNNHCQNFPNDIRFTKEDGVTKHDYWIESLTGTTPNQLATVIIEVASIPASGDVDFYMYYGKPSDSGESAGDDTFRFFDDFSSGESLARNYFLNDVARYGASADPTVCPQAVYHNNKTYIALHGLDLNPYAITYDHLTETWSDKVYVGDNPLGDDGHGQPALLRDSAGHWHIFYGSHASYIQHAKSTNVDDISTWVDKGNIGPSSATYPHPILTDSGDIYLFYRGQVVQTRRPWRYIKSTDNGESWSSPVTVIDVGDYWVYGGRFAHESSTPEKIHLTWMRYNYPTVTEHRNIYYAYLNLSDGHLYAADDTDLGTSIDYTQAENNCKVYNDAVNQCHNMTVRIDSFGIPYIMFYNEPGYKFTKWNGSSWTTPITLGTATIPWNRSCDFILHSPTNMEAYLDEVDKIEKWVYDGSVWSFDSVIADGVDYDNNLCQPAIVENFNDDLKVTFSQCGSGNDKKTFAYGASGFLGDSFTDFNPDKWQTTDSSLYRVIDENLVLDYLTDPTKCLNSKDNFNGYAVEARLKDIGSAPCETHLEMTESLSSVTGKERAAVRLDDSFLVLIGGAETKTGTGVSDTWYRCKIKVPSIGTAGAYIYSDDGGSLIVSKTGTPAYTTAYIALMQTGHSTGYVDWIFIREYVSPEPTWGAWGAEEELGHLSLKLLQRKGLILRLSQGENLS